MLYANDVTEFLRRAGVEAEIHSQGDFPDMPDLLVMLNAAGGPGSTYEREFERVSVQVRVRGSQSEPDKAEALAAQVDAAFMDAEPPITLGGRHVTYIDQLGGPPAFLGRDEAQRAILAATYVFEIARS